MKPFVIWSVLCVARLECGSNVAKGKRQTAGWASPKGAGYSMKFHFLRSVKKSKPSTVL